MKLSAFRRWARGEVVDGMPTGSIQVEVDPPNTVKLENEKFKISADGKDALLKFGKHRGKSLAKVLVEDRSYLRWIASEKEMEEELKDVCRYLLNKKRT